MCFCLLFSPVHLKHPIRVQQRVRGRVRRLQKMQEIDDVAPHLKALKRLTDAKLFPPIYTNCFYRHIQRFKLKSSGALSPCNSQHRGLSPRLRFVMGPEFATSTEMLAVVSLCLEQSLTSVGFMEHRAPSNSF